MNIIRTNNSDVATNWANGVASTNHGKNYTTDGATLWSYNAVIGITTKNGQKVLGDFTASGGQFLSMTTSTKHVSPAKRVVDFARSIIDVFKPRKRLDVGTWGIMGIGMGAAVAAAVETGQRVLAVEGDSAFGFSGMEVETICRYQLPVCVVVFNNNGIYRGTDQNPTGGGDVAPTVFVKDARYAFG